MNAPSMLRAPFPTLLLLGVAAACQATPPPVPEPAGAVPEEGYASVVTADAETDEGVFRVHRVDGKLLFEIPVGLLGRDFLLVSRIARVPADLGSGFTAAGHKTGEQVVRWERMDERVLLRKVSYRNIADEEQPIYRSVVNNNFFPILAAFDVAAEGGAAVEGGDGDVGEEPSAASPSAGGDAEPTVVIDVTDFFQKDVAAISGLSSASRKRYEVKRLDERRSFITTARAFPENVDVRHTLTFEAGKPPSDSSARTLSMEMHQSMILLPQEPMRPRFADHRVGWFTLSRTNFGLDRQKSTEERILRRWRLEPSDPAAYARGELVEPVEPIVYYVDAATPDKWRPYVHQGIEDWQGAFEAAGFANAIQARDAPTPEEDPEWSGEDVRHSVVRWAATTMRNAMGPSVSDPRSGEILESDIVWYHNHLRSYRNRLLIETGAANPLARSLPVDDELLGEAVRQVIAHEVGHALGLPHNMLASSSYPVESLRDPEFAARMGVSASIMDYARQNYVAQPGDGLEGADFIRRIGPYDRYAIEWGYRVIPGVESAEEEQPVLDAWILAKAGDPMFRFGDRSSVDPRAQTEDLGDDPVAASRYGVANLKRVASRLVEWTSVPGEGYADLEELHGELAGTFSMYMGHVATLIGGVHEDRKAGDQEGRVHRAVPGKEQRRAMAFLAEHVFRTPRWLLDPEILRRIGSGGELDRVAKLQSRFLDRLLSTGRMTRLVETEADQGAQPYTLTELFEDVRRVVWSAEPDAYARALQRAHVGRLRSLLTSEDLERSDARALARWHLVEIAADAAERATSAADRLVRAHFTGIASNIEAFLAGREPGG